MIRHCEQHGKDYQTAVKSVGGLDVDVGQCPDCSLALVNALRQQGERENVEQVQVHNLELERAARKKRFDRVGIPPRFQRRNFDNYMASTEGQKKALRQVRGYCEKLCGGNFGGLILSGHVGNGKTHLACAVGMAAEKAGKSVMFLSVLEMIRKLRETYGGGSEVKLQEAVNQFRDLDLLILDEVGVQSGSDDELLLLIDVINARYGWEKPTILISNLDIEGLEGLLGDRIIDRMREDGGLLVHFDWESYRRQRPSSAADGGG